MKFLICTLIVPCLALVAPAATFTVLNTNDAGAGSLRQAILDSNSDTSPDAIAFDIPGTGMRVIRLLSALPAVAQPVIIDGFTQPGARANYDPTRNVALWGVELDGTMAGANRDGLELQANVTVRGLRIANFNGFGIDMVGDHSTVAGCYILSNRLGGVHLDEVDHGLVGGSSPEDINVISGNLGSGVVLDDHGMSNRVLGNFIGTEWDGVRSNGNQGWGVHIFGPLRGNFIGGTNSGEANVIAFNSSGGVWSDAGNAWDNSIRGNRIFSNGGLGIDLGDLGFLSGVTTNDFGDGDDFGANHLQNYPLITNAVINATTTTVQGSLNSRPNTQFALDFYGNTECDVSGFGEGEFFLGSGSVTTDSSGNASFEASVPTATSWGRYLTATATDPLGNTSEFSPCRAATVVARTLIVVNTNDSGPGSLRQAILDSVGANTFPIRIVFNIPGTGVQVIKLLCGLHPIPETVTIDGFTQPGASANTLANGNNANWLIELDGAMAGNSTGLELLRDTNVRGLRISNFRGSGIGVRSGCVVTGCYVTGNLDGVSFDDDSENVLIGGVTPADRNIISGNIGHGLRLDGNMPHRVLGNWIGTDLTGTGGFGNQGWGVLAQYVNGTHIGGTNTGEANVIAFNDSGGVHMLSRESPIRGNRIFSNGGLGIDLDYPPGVSMNDPGDIDIGANQLQNFPLITNVIVNQTTTTVRGRLNSHSNTQYALDFYGNTEGDISGHGEGEIYVGSAGIMTDGNGDASFEVTFPWQVLGYVTATATDPLGNTSEFSPSWPHPLRLEFTRLFGERHELTLRNLDGSPVPSERLTGLRVLASPDLLGWTSIPNTLELTNGLIRVRGLELTNGVRFFRSVEGVFPPMVPGGQIQR